MAGGQYIFFLKTEKGWQVVPFFENFKMAGEYCLFWGGETKKCLAGIAFFETKKGWKLKIG